MSNPGAVCLTDGNRNCRDGDRRSSVKRTMTSCRSFKKLSRTVDSSAQDRPNQPGKPGEPTADD